MTTLTKAILLEKAKPRFEWVEVGGFGRVGIRTCPQVRLSRRYVSYTDQATGEMIPEEQAKSGIHRLIDQLMETEERPMFTDDDFEMLADLDPEKLSPLFDAIETFNGNEPKNE